MMHRGNEDVDWDEVFRLLDQMAEILSKVEAMRYKWENNK